MLSHKNAARRPNLLIVLTDQQRSNAVGYVNPLVKTPNLNRLAAGGLVCHTAVVQSPQCQPSRASLLTGRYPTAHRVWWNKTPLNPAERTIANHLRANGYATGYFGKLHVDGRGGHREVAKHFGFDASFLFEDWSNLSTQGVVGAEQTPAYREFRAAMGTPTWTGRLSQWAFHHEEVITTEAVSFMEAAPQPFFAMVGYFGPHPPYAAPDEFSSLYPRETLPLPPQAVRTRAGHRLTADEWRELLAQYYGLVSWIDDNVGRLLACVERIGPTVVVFTSDHGDILGDHGHFSKGLFAYEGNVRVPLIFGYPGLTGDYRHLVQSIDIFPTVCAMLDLPPPRGLQGLNLLKSFQSGDFANRYALSMIGHTPRLRMIRTYRHKYWLMGDEEHLYDLTADLAENWNLASQERETREQLRFLLLQALIRAEDPLPMPS